MANPQTGNFVWYDLLTNDPKAAIAFYGEVVGWKTRPFDKNPDYTMWVASQGPLGGVMKMPDVPSRWMAHVGVSSVDSACARVKELGGKIHREPSDIPTVGRFAVIADPFGASISVFQPQGSMASMQLHDTEKEGELSWNELVTPDFAKAFDFYRALFGWKVIDDMDRGPAGTYRIYGVGDKPLGGMMNTPKGYPTQTAWVHYVQVADVDAAAARAKKQGAKVLVPPRDVPGGGRIAQCLDPQGAMFALHQSPKK